MIYLVYGLGFYLLIGIIVAIVSKRLKSMFTWGFDLAGEIIDSDFGGSSDNSWSSSSYDSGDSGGDGGGDGGGD